MSIRVKTTSGRHKPQRMADGYIREDQEDLANRHAECEDCHNPHAVSPGVSPNVKSGTPTTNLAANVLRGTWGVEPNNYRTGGLPAWTVAAQSGGYTEINNIRPGVDYQYQLCLKCHSSYAFDLSPPMSPYNNPALGIGPAGSYNSDQAKEFNPNNVSFHPVVTTGKNNFYSEAIGYDYSSSLIDGMTPNSVMGCSDCHSDSQNPSGLKGPHGADYWPIIWGPYTKNTGMTGTQNDLCFKCHDWTVYAEGDAIAAANKTGFRAETGSGGNVKIKNMHIRHVEVRNMPCLACHAAVPHGMPQRALLV